VSKSLTTREFSTAASEVDNTLPEGATQVSWREAAERKQFLNKNAFYPDGVCRMHAALVFVNSAGDFFVGEKKFGGGVRKSTSFKWVLSPGNKGAKSHDRLFPGVCRFIPVGAT
jgi:hypothetical protein